MQLVDALVTTLRDWDVRYVFGVSGANIEHLHDAICRLGEDRLRSILTRSEIGAAFMADCRSRVHRTLGVCCATSGGGMMHLAVGVAEAQADAAPLLAIVGQAPTPLEGRGAFQDSSGLSGSINAETMFASISKYCAKVTCPSQFWQALKEAVTASLSGRQGSSVLLIPRDLYEMEVPPPPAGFPKRLEEMAIRPPVDEKAALRLLAAIKDAACPLLLLGPGVLRSTDPAAVVKFARRYGLPAVTTLSAKAAFPNDDPHYLGTVGVAGEPSAHAFIAEKVDLLVAVGSGLSVMTRGPLKASLPEKRVAIVNVERPAWLARLATGGFVHGDAGDVFRLMGASAEWRGMSPRPLPTLQRKCFLPVLAEDAPAGGAARDGDDLLQSEAIEMLAEILPRRGHVLFDAGNCAAAALHYLRLPGGVTSTIALGMGGMGYAIAASVGAQLGCPAENRTVVFCGDGAFLMQGFEAHTAVEHGLPILFVIFNNSMHGMCVTRQNLFFDGRYEATTFPRCSFGHVARGLGGPDRLWVGSAGTAGELTDCLRDYRRRSHLPGVLELRLTREEVPPFTPFLPEDAATYAAGAGPALPAGPTRRPPVLREVLEAAGIR